MAEIYQIPESQGTGGIPFSIPIGGNGGGLFGNGGNTIGELIGEASSPEQWWDTMAHEVLDHAKESIKAYYGVPTRSEDSAWLTGYLMRAVVTIFGMPCG